MRSYGTDRHKNISLFDYGFQILWCNILFLNLSLRKHFPKLLISNFLQKPINLQVGGSDKKGGGTVSVLNLMIKSH